MDLFQFFYFYKAQPLSSCLFFYRGRCFGNKQLKTHKQMQQPHVSDTYIKSWSNWKCCSPGWQQCHHCGIQTAFLAVAVQRRSPTVPGEMVKALSHSHQTSCLRTHSVAVWKVTSATQLPPPPKAISDSLRNISSLILPIRLSKHHSPTALRPKKAPL